MECRGPPTLLRVVHAMRTLRRRIVLRARMAALLRARAQVTVLEYPSLSLSHFFRATFIYTFTQKE